MKVGLFNTVRGGVERFAKSATRYEGQIELMGFDCPPTLENLYVAKGCDAIIYTAPKKEPEEFWRILAKTGVKYVLTCTAGYDHLNLEAMKKFGLKGAYVPFYSPNAISEHTIMSILALLRNYRKQLHNIDKNNYMLSGLMGKEIRNQIFGIVGAGRIGYTTMKCLSGFEPSKIYTYDPFPNDNVKKYAEYVNLDKLYEKADIIIYHCIYDEQNHHMVNAQTIEKMKTGVLLINVARGGLFDSQAILAGIESGKLGGVAIDVLEEEGVLKKLSGALECPVPVLQKLLQYDNVIYTSHTAFFTDEADKNMSDTTIDNLYSYITTGQCKYELIK